MICTRCGSTRLYQFTATPQPSARPDPGELPQVCRGCGLITIDGQEVKLPEKLELAAKSMVEAQESAVDAATAELEEKPEQDIEGYMRNFYKAAYLEGFFRALAFFRHDAKEGRIKRLRTLWGKQLSLSRNESGETTLTFATAEYNEFVQLLHLNAVPGEEYAKSNPHRRSTK